MSFMHNKTGFDARISVTVAPDGEVVIVGNRAGLCWLVRCCLAILRHPDEGHIHLRNEGSVLTDDSNDCVIRYLELWDSGVNAICKNVVPPNYFKWVVIFSVIIILSSIALLVLL